MQQVYISIDLDGLFVSSGGVQLVYIRIYMFSIVGVHQYICMSTGGVRQYGSGCESRAIQLPLPAAPCSQVQQCAVQHRG